MVALTFDDGPKRKTTERLLDALADLEVPATFFVLGKSVEGNEDLILRMGAEGHQIGVHSYDHVALTNLSSDDYGLQVTRTQDVLASILPDKTFWLRPPYGDLDDALLLRSYSPIILWSVDPRDWEDRSVAQIVKSVMDNTKDGDIILLHDVYDRSVDAAIAIIENLEAKGYTFVTVEELMGCRSLSPVNGVVYRHVY